MAIEFLKAKQQKHRLESVGLDADALLELMDIHYEKGVLSPGFADVFIASFSAAEDLKSQWIDYGMAYRGVSIAFDLQQARPPNELDTSVTLAPCVYKKDRQELPCNGRRAPLVPEWHEASAQGCVGDPPLRLRQ